MNILYVGNSTELDEEGNPLRHQVRYEVVLVNLLKRKYEIWELGRLSHQTDWGEITPSHVGKDTPSYDNVMVEFAKVEDDN